MNQWCIVTKIRTRICLYTHYQCSEFQQDQSMCLRVRANFVICAKRRKRGEKKNEEQKLKFWSLGNTWRKLIQFWNPASPYKQAVPQQIGDFQVKIHGSMNA